MTVYTSPPMHTLNLLFPWWISASDPWQKGRPLIPARKRKYTWRHLKEKVRFLSKPKQALIFFHLSLSQEISQRRKRMFWRNRQHRKRGIKKENLVDRDREKKKKSYGKSVSPYGEEFNAWQISRKLSKVNLSRPMPHLRREREKKRIFGNLFNAEGSLKKVRFFNILSANHIPYSQREKERGPPAAQKWESAP